MLAWDSSDRDSRGQSGNRVFFGTNFALFTNSWTFQKSGPVTTGNRAGVLERTADGDKNE